MGWKDLIKRIIGKSTKNFVIPEEKATTDTINNAREKYELAQNQLGNAYKARARALNTLSELATKLQDIALPKEKRELFVEKGKDCERYIDNIDKEIKSAEQKVSYSLGVLNNEISKFKKQTKGEVDEKDILSNGVKHEKIARSKKGPAPKPPNPPKSIVSNPVVVLQPVRPAPPPPGTTAHKLGKALEEFEEQKQRKGIVKQSTGELRRVKVAPESPKNIRGYLQTLAKGVEISGIYERSIDGKYEGSKEYLLRAVDDLKYFKLINDDKSMKIQGTLNNPKLTKEEFIRTIKTLVETIDMDIESKVFKAKQKDADHAQRIQKERDGKGKEETYRL